MTRTLLAPLSLSLMVLVPGGFAAQPSAELDDPTDQARAVAESWLALLDQGDFEASWEETAGILQSAVTAESWAAQAGGIRGQMGALVSREFAQAEHMTDPPGAPAGDYVQLRFESEFATTGRISEVVITIHEADRGWRVAGYFMEPPEG